ncbi:MAG TPA: hypothetical protein VMM78_18900 [Thermomicrobiales bacterium]|nr:hypothetical protein [Thermomicrobiales bacterium]
MRKLAIVPLIVGLLAVATVEPTLAAERTAVFQSDLTVPILGTRSVGVLTVNYDDVTGEGSWVYEGTIDGEPASASGRGDSVVEAGGGQGAESSFQLTMTSIDTWQMPGLEPDVPREATIRSSGSMAYVNYQGPVFSLLAIPVAIDPPLAFPIEGVYVLTNAGSGDEAVTEIPRTGVGPDGGAGIGSGLLTASLIATCVALLVATSLLGTSQRLPRRVRVRARRGAGRVGD